MVDEEKFVVANIGDMKQFDKKFAAASYTEANQHYQQLIKKDPGLRDQLQVLSAIEVNSN